jgi:hypothetical protein
MTGAALARKTRSASCFCPLPTETTAIPPNRRIRSYSAVFLPDLPVAALRRHYQDEVEYRLDRAGRKPLVRWRGSSTGYETYLGSVIRR